MLLDNFDNIKAALFIAAFFINRQAAIVIACHIASELIYASPLNGFYTAITTAAMFSIASIINIKVKSEIRHVLLGLGVVNWLCAIDLLASPNAETRFTFMFPLLINALDLIIIYHLFSKGGLNLAGNHSRSGNSANANLYLLAESKKTLRTGKAK